MKKINEGVFVTSAGMVLSGEQRQYLANLLGLDGTGAPVTVDREHVKKVLRNERSAKCYCDHGLVVLGDPGTDIWLSQEAALITKDAEQWRELYEWVMEEV